MPDPITMTGQYACRIAPYDQVRVICVDGPDPERPVAFYDAEGRLDCCDAYGKNSDDNYDLIPLQVRRRPVEAWAVLRADGTVYECWARKSYADEDAARIPGARLVRLVEAEDGK